MPLFRDVTSDAQLKGLQARLNINRDKANLLGVQIADIRTALYSAFGERQVSTIYTSERQLPGDHAGRRRGPHRRERASARFMCAQRTARWFRCPALRPSSAKSDRSRSIMPGSLQALTISFNLAPGAALGDASKRIEQFKRELNHAGRASHQLRRRRRRVPVVAEPARWC